MIENFYLIVQSLCKISWSTEFRMENIQKFHCVNTSNIYFFIVEFCFSCLTIDIEG